MCRINRRQRLRIFWKARGGSAATGWGASVLSVPRCCCHQSDVAVHTWLDRASDQAQDPLSRVLGRKPLVVFPKDAIRLNPVPVPHLRRRGDIPVLDSVSLHPCFRAGHPSRLLGRRWSSVELAILIEPPPAIPIFRGSEEQMNPRCGLCFRLGRFGGVLAVGLSVPFVES